SFPCFLGALRRLMARIICQQNCPADPGSEAVRRLRSPAPHCLLCPEMFILSSFHKSCRKGFHMRNLLCGICLLLLAVPAVSQSAPSSGNPIKFDVKNMDTSIDPCVDFYKYACGGWMKANPIPGDQVRWGRFNQLAEDNLAVLHTILEQASKSDP